MEKVHAAHDALAASALVLAKALDDGAGLATAAVARQHAAILTTLAEGGDDDAVAELVADVSPRACRGGRRRGLAVIHTGCGWLRSAVSWERRSCRGSGTRLTWRWRSTLLQGCWHTGR